MRVCCLLLMIQSPKLTRAKSPKLTSCNTYAQNTSNMKRKADFSVKSPAAKRQRESEPDYCDAVPRTGGNGFTIWPAPAEAMESARKFLRQWYAMICKSRRYKAAHSNNLVLRLMLRHLSYRIRTQMDLMLVSSSTGPLL